MSKIPALDLKPSDNQFGVGSNARGIFIMAPPHRAMSREEAIYLAAWLGVIAGAISGEVDKAIEELINAQ